MNIVIMGAGAIGSLFGGLLSRENNVLLIGRTTHVDAIKKQGLKITGKTKTSMQVSATGSIKNITFFPDLLILTVKSYDTENAIKQAKLIMNEDTTILSLQNGLDNINKIEKIVKREKIIAGVTTHGVLFSKPGCIEHTGLGRTILGELDGETTDRLKHVIDVFNNAGIKTSSSSNILKDIWVKAIINSSINPLTTIFQCKNAYLLENPVLEKIIESICIESTAVANKTGIKLNSQDMYEKTWDVIYKTAENYSSMFQSFKKGKNTEIDSINGRIVDIGKNYDVDTSLNEILVCLVKFICKNQ